jgi:molybdopterin converting factor small subunit
MATQTTIPTVTIHVPTPLRSMTDDRETVEVQGETIRDVLGALTDEFSELRQHLYTEDGSLRSFVNIYVDDEDIRYLDNEETELQEGQTVSIVPSIAGGYDRLHQYRQLY